MASTIDHTRQISSTSHYPDTKRRRVQVSDATSYDGPMDGLSLIPHTYQSSRIGAPPLMLLPLASSEIDERSELYLKYNAPQTQEDIDRILRYKRSSIIIKSRLEYVLTFAIENTTSRSTLKICIYDM